MKRVKTKPKKQKRITITPMQLNKIKRDITKVATDKACLILLAAATDELNLTEEQFCDVMVRTDRYAEYVDSHIAKMEDIRKTIEKSTGITLKGWAE